MDTRDVASRAIQETMLVMLNGLQDLEHERGDFLKECYRAMAAAVSTATNVHIESNADFGCARRCACACVRVRVRVCVCACVCVVRLWEVG